jgi:adenylate kinase family enzyme
MLQKTYSPTAKRIIIIGCGGSGKSTLAIKLGAKLSLPVHHLDRIFWQPGWVSMPRDQFTAIQKDLVSSDTWIIDGNYDHTLDLRLAACDMAIFLDMPRVTCLWNVLKRRVMYHGQTRPDLNEGCPEKIDAEFLRWIWHFNQDIRPGMVEKLKHLDQGKQVVILKSPQQVKPFLNSIVSQP